MASLSLTIIVRVENIPWTANALDIRKYFAGLNIPEGGVHIIGGERGVAYVAFQTAEDLSKAMQLNGGIINNAQVNLQESSRSEMVEMIEKVRTGKLNMAAQLFPRSVRVPILASHRLPYSSTFKEMDGAKREATLQNCVPLDTQEPMQPVPGDAESQKKNAEGLDKTETKRLRVDAFAAVPPVHSPDSNWFLELRNLHKEVSHSEIAAFLHDCKPSSENDVVIVPWMGRALVHIHGPVNLRDLAMAKNGEIMRDLATEVVEVTDREFAMAKEATREAANIVVASANVPRSRQPQKSTNSPLPPGTSSSPPKLPTVSTEYIKLSNLPLQYQWHNIRALFPSARIAKDGLKLEKDPQGHFTGVALLKFTNLEECGKALERLCNMKYEVTLLTREEYEYGTAAADGRMPSAEPSYNPNVRYVAVKNIEEGSNAENVCSIFRGLDINPATDVVFLSGGQVALVRLKSEFDQQAALRRNRSLLGQMTVIVEPATHADFEQALSHTNFPQFGSPGCSIMMQNLTTSMDQQEVLALVESFQPLPDTLRMHYDDSGRATGRAIIAFARPEAAQRASAHLHGKVVGGQALNITVF